MQSFFKPKPYMSGSFDRPQRTFGEVSGATQPATQQQPAQQPVQQQQQAAPQQTPAATQQAAPQALTPEQRAEVIKRAYTHWDENLPAKQWADLFAQAPDIAPIYKQHPYLPAISPLIETGGGKNMLYENNPINWGKYPYDTAEDAIMKMMTGVGYRMEQYEPFRQSGDFRDLAKVYAPSGPPDYNDLEQYIRNYESILNVFQQAEETYRGELQGR